MANLRETAMQSKAKKELYDLGKLDLDKLEVKTDTFPSKDDPDKHISYNYIEIDGWQYAIKAKLMQQIKYILESKPNTKYIRFMRAPDGSTFVMDVE